ncbi:unnamed protein product [Prorocentrum cordatum]|uniref:Mei2-like C-terminal RNA recognition motif domain-containing protein n=1 Tax=Prorocentrum cordatum TaxID=2364126 RepID=A0ABN9QJQ0_9DINO|nr:unnamed protein product [Polarella glacialis]
MGPPSGPSSPHTFSTRARDPGYYLDGSVSETHRLGPRPRQPAAAGPGGDRPLRQVSTQTQTATTAMLRNLPCGLTRKALIWTLNNKGFAGLYDFVYVPIDCESGLCMGFAFVNLTSAEHVQYLKEAFDGHSRWSTRLRACPKVCSVTLSKTQGLAANIERYRNSPVLGDQVPESFKPALFVGGRQVSFPEPVRRSRLPVRAHGQ